VKDNFHHLLSVEEAAEYLGLSKHTIRAWLIQRRLPFLKLGGRVLLRHEDLVAFVNSNVVQNQ
jgi:excisionase family DNA binding protein